MTGIGMRIKQIREKLGMSIQDLSFEARVSVQVIHAIESGVTRNPSASTIRALARGLQTTADYLLSDDDTACV